MTTTYKYCLPIQKRICTPESILSLIADYKASLTSDEDFNEPVDKMLFQTVCNVQVDEDKTVSVCMANARLKRKRNDFNFCDLLAVFLHESKDKVIREALMFDIEKNLVFLECSANSPKIEEIQSPFLKFAFKKRIVGDANGFRITRSPIYLRLEDAPKLKKLLLEPSESDTPVLLIRSNKGVLSKEVNDLCGIALVLIMDDIDLIEELEEVYDMKNAIPDPDTMWLIQNGDFEKNFAYNEQELATVKEHLIENYDRMFDSVLFDSAFLMSNLAADQLNSLQDERRHVEQALSQAKAALVQKNSADFSKTFAPQTKKPNVNPGTPLIVKGDEKDLFPDEIRDIILDCLKDYRQNYTAEDSRRAHVLDDILEKNKPSGELEKRRTQVRELLSRAEKTSSPKFINDLEKAGFKIKSTNKHIKALWMNDPRYVVSIAKTPGDGVCGAENLAHKAENKIF